MVHFLGTYCVLCAVGFTFGFFEGFFHVCWYLFRPCLCILPYLLWLGTGLRSSLLHVPLSWWGLLSVPLPLCMFGSLGRLIFWLYFLHPILCLGLFLLFCGFLLAYFLFSLPPPLQFWCAVCFGFQNIFSLFLFFRFLCLFYMPLGIFFGVFSCLQELLLFLRCWFFLSYLFSALSFLVCFFKIFVIVLSASS